MVDMQGKIFGTISSLSLLLLFLYVAIHVPTFSMSTYQNHYDYFGTANIIGISDEDLLAVTKRLLGYISGRYNDLQIYATVQGVYRPFFTQREIYHMADVLLLFNIARLMAAFCLVIVVATWFWAIKRKALRIFYKTNFIAGLVVCVFVLMLAILFSNDFVYHFHRFHDIFFFFDYEQLWLLDPRYDMLINMVPYDFFINIFISVGIIFSSLTVLLTVSFGILMYKRK